MRAGAWTAALGACALALPAAAQEGGPAEPVTVTARVRHVTTIALPASEAIVDVVVGDAERWDVSAAAHLAFVRPLAEGARSNLVLLTAAGAVLPVALVERADAAPDALVRIGAPGAAGPPAPVLAAADAATAAAARAAEAWEAVAAAEARAAERVESARSAAREALDARRAAYPGRLRFPYRWAASPAGEPWRVEAMWHDGRRTYLRSRAELPALYEEVGGGLAPVPAEVAGGSLFIVPRVLGPGVLEAGGKRRAWTVEPRRGDR